MRLTARFSTIIFLLTIRAAFAQLPDPALIGYWHNWNDINAPYLQLDAIDSRYNVIEVAFAEPVSPTDMTMTFTPDIVTSTVLISKIQWLQSQGKKVMLSIGGANTSIDLTTTANKNAFVSSLTSLINTYGFDGIDIDIEHGNAILVTGGTIAAPANIAQVNLIDAIKQVMAAYSANHGRKLLLTMAPETAYVQGGQSAFGSIWGGYLPIIDALRDSLDVLQVQLYNSGSMYGIDGNIYYQGSADFIVAMTEAVIQGFNTAGGYFAGLPSNKVAIGLPACGSAAGGGFTDSATVHAAVSYLKGSGSRPGTYSLATAAGYPFLRGMMTWSINWDAVSTCANTYQYATNYENLFVVATDISTDASTVPVHVYPNPSHGIITVETPSVPARIVIRNLLGQVFFEESELERRVDIHLEEAGVYLMNVLTAEGSVFKRIVVKGD